MHIFLSLNNINCSDFEITAINITAKYIHGKNGKKERYRSENNFVEPSSNNYVGTQTWWAMLQKILTFWQLAWAILHNYFHSPTKLFLDLYYKLNV